MQHRSWTVICGNWSGLCHVVLGSGHLICSSVESCVDDTHPMAEMTHDHDTCVGLTSNTNQYKYFRKYVLEISSDFQPRLRETQGFICQGFCSWPVKMS